MAYGSRWHLKYTDRYNSAWEVYIQERDYVGSATACTGGPMPCTIELLAASDDPFEKIKATQATVEILDTTGGTFEDIFLSDHFKYRLLVYKDSAVYWSGWPDNQTYQEPYKDAPYIITLTFSCGLGFLKNYPYKETDGTILSGVVGLDDVLWHAMYPINSGLDLNFYDGVDIYETTVGVNDRYFSSKYLNQDKYVNDDGTVLTCYDVLIDIIPLTCHIIQAGGYWHIRRHGALSGGYTAYLGTNGTTGIGWVKIFESFTPPLATTATTEAAATRVLFVGDMKSKVPALRDFDIMQNFMPKNSVIDNHSFTEYTILGTGGRTDLMPASFSNWEKSSVDLDVGVSKSSIIFGTGRAGVNVSPFERLIREYEKRSKTQNKSVVCCISGGNISSLGDARWLAAVNTPYLEAAKLSVSFKYAATNGSDIYVRIELSDGVDTYYLANDGADADSELDWTTNSATGYLKLGEQVLSGWNQLEAFSAITETMPIDGYLTVKLLEPINASAADVAYFDDIVIIPDGAIYLSDISLNTLIDANNRGSVNYEISLGDPIDTPSFFTAYLGGLYLDDDGTPTTAWAYGGSTDYEPLMIDLTDGEGGIYPQLIAEQYSKDRDIITGKLHSGIFDFTRILTDTYNSSKNFVPLRMKLDTKRGEWDFEGIEVENYDTPMVDEGLDPMVDESANEMVG